MTKIREFYELIDLEENIVIDKSNKNIKKDNSAAMTTILQKIYHLIAIKLQNIIIFLFNLNDEKYNELLLKSKFGILIGELLIIQYKILGEIFDKNKNDIQLLNVFLI